MRGGRCILLPRTHAVAAVCAWVNVCVCVCTHACVMCACVRARVCICVRARAWCNLNLPNRQMCSCSYGLYACKCMYVRVECRCSCPSDTHLKSTIDAHQGTSCAHSAIRFLRSHARVRVSAQVCTFVLSTCRGWWSTYFSNTSHTRRALARTRVHTQPGNPMTGRTLERPQSERGYRFDMSVGPK